MLPVHWLRLTLQIPGSAAVFAQTREFWAAVTGTSAYVANDESGTVTLEPAAGTPYLALEPARDDGNSAASDGRCALVIQLAPGSSLTAARDSALALGARVAGQEPGVVRLKSPAGYGFSVTVAPEEYVAVPPAVTVADGGLSQADQLCIDIPPGRFDEECRFWPALTGLALSADDGSEFRHLIGPPTLPLRFLLQRRDHAEAGENATAHLDLATQDRRLLATVHVGLGATLAGEWDEWISLRDPAGRIYCLTRRPVATI